jgi:hypothetical protein
LERVNTYWNVLSLTVSGWLENSIENAGIGNQRDMAIAQVALVFSSSLLSILNLDQVTQILTSPLPFGIKLAQ